MDMIYTPPKGHKTFDTLDIGGRGITSYWSARIEGNRLRYKDTTCSCITCINGKYSRQCNKTAYYGRWSSFISIPVHRTYTQLLSLNMNHNK